MDEEKMNKLLGKRKLINKDEKKGKIKVFLVSATLT